MNITEPFSMTQSVNAAAMLAWSWLSRKVGACARREMVSKNFRAIYIFSP
jgi:hypothetical protein